MTLRAGLHMVLGAAVLSGCAAPAAVGPTTGRALRVTDAAMSLANDEGARAKRIANDICGPRGVRSSIDDRYEGGAWVFVRGCA